MRSARPGLAESLEWSFYMAIALVVLIVSVRTGSATPILLLAMCLVAGALVRYSQPPKRRNR